MTTRNRPNYGVFPLVLTAAGTLELPVIGTRITMTAAVIGTAATVALVNVQIGKALGDPLPFSVGSDVVVANKFDYVRLSWAAQAGVIATIVISDDADGNGIHVSAIPAVAAGSVSIVAAGNTATVTGGGALVTQGTLQLKGGGSTGTTIVTNPALNNLPQSGNATLDQVQPGSYGASFASSVSSANGNTVIVAAASNVNGVVIRSCVVTAPVAGGVGLFAGTTVPTTLVNRNPICVELSANLQNALAREIFVPAGQGIHLFSGAAGQSYFISYDIL